MKILAPRRNQHMQRSTTQIQTARQQHDEQKSKNFKWIIETDDQEH